MSVYAGPSDSWTDNSGAGRIHIATKGIIQSGLSLNLDPGASTSYPGSGTSFTDLSTNSLACSLNNGATFSSNNGGVIIVDGIDDFIKTPQIVGSGTATESHTFCVWVKPNDTQGNILSMSNFDPPSNWQMPPIYATGSKFGVRVWSNSLLSAPNTYTNNVWYYVCLVFNYDATQANRFLRLYVNGVLEAEQTNITYSSSGSNNFLFFGNAIPGAAGDVGAFTCQYGPIHCYRNKALSQAEILHNFYATRGRFGI